MPIDQTIMNSILGTFIQMQEQCRQQNLTGEHVDQMSVVLSRIEQLGQEHSDFNAFNAQVAQENLYAKFSEHYSKALSEQHSSQQSASTGHYDDSSLLNSCLDGLRSSVKTIEDSYKRAIEEAKGSNNEVEVAILQDPTENIKPIQELIQLGEQANMTLPDFLRIQIEKGLDKAMEGSVVVLKSLYIEKEFAETNPASPYEIHLAEEKIALYEDLKKKSAFGVPEAKEWSLLRDETERKYARDMIVFKKTTGMWEKLLSDLHLWSLSYTDFAPYIQPWSLSENPKASVMETRHIQPGIFAEREKLLLKYFDICFTDIFSHPTFLWSVNYDYIQYSQEFLEFLLHHIYPLCRPFQHLDSTTIEKRAAFHESGPLKADRETNPGITNPALRNQKLYDLKFGQDSFEKKYGIIPHCQSKAKPWDIQSFRK